MSQQTALNFEGENTARGQRRQKRLAWTAHVGWRDVFCQAVEFYGSQLAMSRAFGIDKGTVWKLSSGRSDAGPKVLGLLMKFHRNRYWRSMSDQGRAARG